MKYALALVVLGLFVFGPALADDPATYEIVLKDHAFTPAEIHVPTGKPFVILVTNQNDGADEFEMLIPAVEKGVPTHGQARVRMRPLGPGRFAFFGEGDPDNEKGVVIAE